MDVYEATACDVCVIIPCYNASKTIYRTLSSVLAQSILPSEIIIIDDASLDYEHLRSEISKINVPQGVSVRLIRNPRNLNGAASRNIGIEAASAKYVAFLDADDEWLPNKLERCLTAIGDSEHGDGSYVMAYSKVNVVSGSEKIAIRPERGICTGEHMSEYLFLSGGFIQTSTIVCSREIASKVLFNPDFKRHQDYDFCLRLAAAGTLPIFVDEPLVRYHSTPGIFGQRSEDPNYTREWGETMRPWMSSHGYHGFGFFLVSGRFAKEKKYILAAKNAINHLFYLGPSGLWKARYKILMIANRFVG